MSELHLHPPDEALRDFLLGKLPDPDDSHVESHLAECPDCQSRAAASCTEDTFISLLAAARTRVDAAHADARTVTVIGTDATPSFARTGDWDGVVLPASDELPPVELAAHPKYRVLRRLGVGGMGSVWLAEHAVMKRAVAVKVIRPEYLAKPGAGERFLREVQAAARLHHPNIVTAFDAEEANGSCLLAMEYVSGETLSDVVKRGPLTPDEACRAIRDAARGLAHAHAAGLVHRDVKPGNLMREASRDASVPGVVKVLDFGLVIVGSDRESGLTGENMVMGTPDYIAPEQAEDARTADARSDVYALGCTLYHLLAGRVPYPADTTLKKLDAHRDPDRSPEPLTGVPAELAAVVAKMMAKRPEERYQTAADVVEALEPFCVTLAADSMSGAASARRSGSTGGLTPRRSSRRLLVAAGLLFALVGLAAGGVVYKIQRDNEVITLKADDPDIEVVMKRNGELVRIVDTKTGQVWELNTRKLRLKPDGSDLSIDLSEKEPLVIRRNGDVAVTIRREPKPAPAEKPISRSADPDLVRTFVGHTGTVRAVACSPDGKHFASVSGWPFGDGTVRLWDAATGRTEWMRPTAVSLTGVAFTPDDRVIVVGDGSVAEILDWRTDSLHLRLTTRKPVRDHAIAVSPDGKLAITGDLDSAVRVWDTRTGAELRSFVRHAGAVVAVGFSPDGKLAASVGGGSVRVWNVETLSEKKVYRSSKPPFGSTVTFTKDGQHVLFAEEGTAVLWSIETGEAVRRFEGEGPGGACLALSADCRRLLTGGGDGILRVWDFDTGTLIREFPNNGDRIGGLAITPDGKFGLAGYGGRFKGGQILPGSDYALRLWRLPEPKSP